jgi:4-amino-4-deoxy-L-arabinose transferase-like glycosyltransferase
MSISSKKYFLIPILLIAIGITGAIFMAWLTPYGVGIYVDSLSYISSACNLVAGIGMGRITGLGEFKPMTHYPPFYSLLLAFFHLLGLPELTTARWLSIFAFGITIILAGLIVYHRTRSSFFSIFVAVLFLLGNPILRNFSWAMTEPLYIVLMLLAFLLLGYYLVNSLRRWLILTALVASCALLTRYVGFSLVGAVCIVLLLNRKLNWRNRLKDLGLFLAIVLLPTLIWLIRNWLISETLTNRVLNWHPISGENISFLIKAVNSWGLLPQRLVVGRETLAFAGIIICLTLAGIIWLIRSIPKAGKSPSLELALLLAGWLYVGLLIISLFFLDATTRLENRILLPLYGIIILLIVIGSALLWQHKTILTRLFVVLMCLWLAYFSFTRVDGAIIDLRSDGQGYASLKWQNSPTAGFIRQQDTSVIFTNDVTAIYFLSGKDSVGIPNASATETDFSKMQENLHSPNSYLVIFGTLTGEFAPLDQLTQGLTLVDSFADGTIYQLR